MQAVVAEMHCRPLAKEKEIMSTPNTLVRFYDVFDLTPDYNHTRYFPDSDTRDAYFNGDGTEGSGKVAVEVETQHIRIDQNEVKVPLPLEEIHSYCYMSIKNSKVRYNQSGYDHIYYCFIVDMEYVSDMCTLVRYQVDVMQTFCMDGLFSDTMAYQSFVTRCHSLTDEVGDNIVEEPFNADDLYIAYKAGATVNLYEYYIVVGVCTTRFNGSPQTIDGEIFNFEPVEYYLGIYTGARYYAFDMSDATSALKLQHFLDLFQGSNMSEIISIYSVPKAVVPTYSAQPSSISTSSPPNDTSVFTDGVNGSQNNEGFEGYDAKNMKLYTYPYTRLRLSNGEGEILDLAFELFDNPDYCQFMIEGAFIGEPQISVYPMDYGIKYGHLASEENYDHSISLTNFCSGAFSSNALASYLQQESFGSLIKCIAGTVVSAGTGYMLGGGALLGGAMSLGAGITPRIALAGRRGMIDAGIMGASSFVRGSADMTADYIRAKNTGDKPSGQNNRGAVAQQNGHKAVRFFRMKIRRYLAEQIDDYFTMYGYAQNKLMNIGDYLENNTRPYFAYVQTSNFSVMYGAFEQKYKMEIANIMNKGITFWFDTEYAIGRYDLNNTPVLG